MVFGWAGFFFLFLPPPPPPPPPPPVDPLPELEMTPPPVLTGPVPPPPPPPPVAGVTGVSGGVWATSVGDGAATMPARSGLSAGPTTTPNPSASAAKVVAIWIGIGNAIPIILPVGPGSDCPGTGRYGIASGGPTR